MDIFLMGEGKLELLKEEHTRKLEKGIVDQRKNLPVLLRELLKIPGEGKCLSIVGGFTHGGVHSEHCWIDFERAIGWGFVVNGMPKFRGVVFHSWADTPMLVKPFIAAVKARVGLS